MFNIDWGELFVIVVVALIVVGPKDLPRMMRKVGQWAGRARAMADQFRRSFDDIARQSELEELRAEVNRLQTSAMDPAAEIESAMYPQGRLPDLNSNLGDESFTAPTPPPADPPPPASSAVPQVLTDTTETPETTAARS
jgi:sec-independent protein translocase protein TatB